MDTQMKFLTSFEFNDPDDPQGRTYKEINTTKLHNIPLGTLVECAESGIRLFVGRHTKDCDGTPLYALTNTRPDDEPANRFYLHGYAEESLKAIQS